MEHSEDVTAVLTANEPADGTVLIVEKGDPWDDREWTVIWRDDAEADRWYDGDARGQHWFDEEDSDPTGLHQQIKYAAAVYALGQPVARFPR